MERPANWWQVACAKTCRQVCIAFAPFSRAPPVNGNGNPAATPTRSPKLAAPAPPATEHVAYLLPALPGCATR